MKDISNDDILALQLVVSKKDVNMEEPVESNQKGVFMQEVINEEELNLYEGLSLSQSDLLT